MTSAVLGSGRSRHPVWVDRHARSRRRLLLLGVLVVAAWAPEAGVAQGVAAPTETTDHVWLDAEGAPLPFQSDAEISDFLQTARVVSRSDIAVGINRAVKLLLEKDGTRAHAVFRVVDIEEKQFQLGPRFYVRFRDSYRNECAAHELARWLGLDSVPPAVLRVLEDRSGSVQIWVENTRDEESPGFAPPNVRAWVKQVWDMNLFDNLILNVDRNAGNILVGQHYRLWLIDHTRAFQPVGDLLAPEKVVKINRRAWDRLLSMTREDMQSVVGEFLDGGQVASLMKRRELLIEHVEGLVAERGEGAVFY